jgi:endonuclease-3 related protein
LQERNNIIKEIYQHLLRFYGPQGWWPGETRLEIIVGAILTQNVSWKNVEKSIERIKASGFMDMDTLISMDDEVLHDFIRSTGYYRQKAGRLKELLKFIKENYGNIENMVFDTNLREKLLAIKGIGKETADSILLYALDLPYFVVDAYTFRIFRRIGIIEESNKVKYEDIREMVEKSLGKNVNDLKEFHALLVALGKDHCKKVPVCEGCPLYSICQRKI